MEGEFSEGLLNGKGQLQVTDCGHEIYCYNGDWRMGSKHGKAVEKGRVGES